MMRQGLTRLAGNTASRPDLPEILLVLAVLLLGAALRFWGIDQIPPGLWYDEAANGIDAQFVLSGDRPIFFAGNNGREPLFIYTIAAAFAVLGPSPLAIRLVAAVFGVASLLLTYMAGYRMFGRRVALLSTLLLAISYWHVSLSRLGLRAGLLPLIELVVAYCLWRALQERSLRWFMASGAALGLVGYTYLAGRFTPLWLGLFLLGALAYRRWRLDMPIKPYLLGLLVWLGAAVVVYAPLGSYFLQNPDQFFHRATSVASTSPDEASVNDILKTIGMFTFAGDENGRHNMPLRPVFDWFQGIAFYAGLVLALVRWRQPAGMFCLLWTAVMLLPGAMSTEAPHFLRTAGILPAPMFLAGLALVEGVDAAESWARRLHQLWPSAVSGLCLVLAMLWGGWSTAYDYFVRYAPSQIAYESFRTDALEAARAARELSGQGEVMLGVPGFYRGQPIPLGVYSLGTWAGRPFGSDSCVVAPPEPNRPLYYIVLGNDGFIKEESKDRLLFGASLVQQIPGRDGKIAAHTYQLPPGPISLRPAEHSTMWRLGEGITIKGYDFPSRAPRGQTLRLYVYWEMLGPFTEQGEWQFFVQAVDENNNRWANTYGDGCPPRLMRQGDRIISWFDLWIPEDTPEGTYQLVLGRFRPQTGERARVYDSAGKDLGDAVRLARFRVTDGVAAEYSPFHVVSAHLGPQIELVGYDLSQARLEAGKPLDLTLYWRGEDGIKKDYTVFAQLLDRDGKVVDQHDGQPQAGQYPTSLWGKGEIVPDRRQLSVPDGLAPQALRLIVGMYDLQTGQRLPVDAGPGQPSDHFILTTLVVD